MKYIKVGLSILLALSASRFIPHPPNFTSLIALSFYVPAFFGIRYIPLVMISLVFTDIIIGLHSAVLFTWGSVFIIGYLAKYLYKSTMYRFLGAFFSASIFYIISNFGVWLNGAYGYSFEGLIECYFMAIPFFGYTLTSTIIFALIIELTLRAFNQSQNSISRYINQ